MNCYERALQERDELLCNRRYLHANAEAGLHMPRAKAFIKQKLLDYGLEPQDCGEGVTALLGSGGKVLLLRADMDALPMKEESGLDFACHGDCAHTCGHDMHAAMLLTAAKLLKESEGQLKGRVKFMFQPAEETFEGAANMLQHGILENPQVDAALGFHVAAGQMPVGIFMYNDSGAMMFSSDGFRIHVKGKGSHGAYPQNSIDPINIACHTHINLQELIARESNPEHACILTIGQMEAGTVQNVIPETAMLAGTIRANKVEARDYLLRRMEEVATGTAAVFGGSAEVEDLPGVPPLLCDPTLTRQMVGYMQEQNIPGAMPHPGITASASEDFATIAQKVPSVFMYLSAGFTDERGAAPAHNPKVLFNEEVLPQGAAWLTHCALRWLEENQ